MLESNHWDGLTLKPPRAYATAESGGHLEGFVLVLRRHLVALVLWVGGCVLLAAYSGVDVAT